MIISLLIQIVIGLLSALFVFRIPSLPSSVYEYIETGFEYISAGAGIVANYVPLGYLMTLFGIVLAVDLAGVTIDLVKFFISKIPFLGIK